MKNKTWLKHVIAAAVTLLLGAAYFYVMLPAINVRSIDLWKMIFFLAVVYAVIYFFAEILTLIHSPTISEGLSFLLSAANAGPAKIGAATRGQIINDRILLSMSEFLL